MSSLNDKLNLIKQARDDIKSSLANKGQIVGNDIRDYSEAIDNIEAGSGVVEYPNEASLLADTSQLINTIGFVAEKPSTETLDILGTFHTRTVINTMMGDEREEQLRCTDVNTLYIPKHFEFSNINEIPQYIGCIRLCRLTTYNNKEYIDMDTAVQLFMPNQMYNNYIIGLGENANIARWTLDNPNSNTVTLTLNNIYGEYIIDHTGGNTYIRITEDSSLVKIELINNIDPTANDTYVLSGEEGQDTNLSVYTNNLFVRHFHTNPPRIYLWDGIKWENKAGSVKLYATTQEMLQDTSVREGDMAIVKGGSYVPVNPYNSLPLTTVSFPDEIIVSTMITSQYNIYAGNGSVCNLEIDLNPVMCRVFNQDTTELYAEYSSNDGIHYTFVSGSRSVTFSPTITVYYPRL